MRTTNYSVFVSVWKHTAILGYYSCTDAQYKLNDTNFILIIIQLEFILFVREASKTIYSIFFDVL